MGGAGLPPEHDADKYRREKCRHAQRQERETPAQRHRGECAEHRPEHETGTAANHVDGQHLAPAFLAEHAGEERHRRRVIGPGEKPQQYQ